MGDSVREWSCVHPSGHSRNRYVETVEVFNPFWWSYVTDNGNDEKANELTQKALIRALSELEDGHATVRTISLSVCNQQY